MDYNAGFWTTHLDDYMHVFTEDNIPFTALKWESDDSNTYYSVLVNPCGYVVIELISDHVGPKHADKFKQSDIRMSFATRNNKPTNVHTVELTAIKVSRATARMDDIKKFYDKDIGASMVFNKKFDDGSELATFLYEKPEK